MRQTTELHSGWQLALVRAADGTPAELSGVAVPATVPGCVHTDLMSAGLLDDPYLDRNEDTQHWVGNSGWRYATTFSTGEPAGDRVELVFDGLDTVATVSVDGSVIGETQNMHRGYRFDVTSLAAGEHKLAVVFRAARDYALEVRDAVGERPNAYAEPFQYVRKMACNFGWDWGPTLLTAGIWKEVRLERWSTARLASVRPEVTVNGTDGEVLLTVDLERAGADTDLLLFAHVGDSGASVSVAAGELSATVRLRVPDVDLWWPHDLGEQVLYDLVVRLTDADGSDLDAWARRIGFRTVVLDTTPDEQGTPFAFSVNGRPVFVRGANWIPDDCFPSRITRERLHTRVRQGVEANANLLRVWGGGMYESDDFYDVCDELGVLVWQDFLFACAAYPEEEPLRSEVEAEAEENVVRLMPHPSLVLWNGNNENIWGFVDWGWKDELQGRTWGLGYYTDLLPAIVADLDPTRAYWPGSPYSGSPDLHPNDPAHGPMHIWTVWNELDYTAYRTHAPRFVAEFGFQGPPDWATLTRAIHDDPLLADSPGVLAHQKADDGNGKLARGMAPHLPAPRDTDDWHYLTQLNQAVAIQTGVEHFRSLRPLCQGTVLWQLNDCWPVTSWAAVDGDGRRKPLWYALRRAFAAQLLTVQPREDALAAVLVNDADLEWSGELELTRRTLTGEVLAKSTVPVTIGVGSQASVPVPAEVTAVEDPYGELLVAELGGLRALWFFAQDRDLPLDPAAASVVAAPSPGGVELTVTAHALVRGLLVQADRVDPAAEVDEQVVTLLAGDTHTVRIATTVAADDPRWLTAPVLRTLNDFAPAALAATTNGE